MIPINVQHSLLKEAVNSKDNVPSLQNFPNQLSESAHQAQAFNAQNAAMNAE